LIVIFFFNPSRDFKKSGFCTIDIKVKMPPTQSRRSYTAAFKLEVAIYAEENGGNMAAQRKYGVVVTNFVFGNLLLYKGTE
jgi:hypothetical protein